MSPSAIKIFVIQSMEEWRQYMPNVWQNVTDSFGKGGIRKRLSMYCKKLRYLNERKSSLFRTEC